MKEEAIVMPRSEAEAESTFTFDGFVAFHCKTRTDSRAVVRADACLR